MSSQGYISSHYAKYVKERDNAETIEDERGFISYKFENGVCFITDIFVDPNFRNLSTGSDFGKMVEKKAKEDGIERMMCTACIESQNFLDAIAFIKSNGYTIFNTVNSLIYFVKEI